MSDQDKSKPPDSVRPAKGAILDLLKLCGNPDGKEPSAQGASAFAAAVLPRGGEVHRIPDGNGGYFQISVINPGALSRRESLN